MNVVKKVFQTILPILVIVCVFALLELAVYVFKISTYLLPAPSTSIKWLFDNFEMVMGHFIHSFFTLISGYLIGSSIGILLAFIFTSSELANNAISPYVTVIVCTPQLIMVPLLMVWLGFGIHVNIIACALSCFAINMMNTTTGVMNVSEARKELMMTLKASKLQTFVMVLIPSALPSVFTGLKLGCIFAISGTIGSEIAGAIKGLGSQVLIYSDNTQMKEAFGMIYMVVLLGVIMYSLVSSVERAVIKKWA